MGYVKLPIHRYTTAAIATYMCYRHKPKMLRVSGRIDFCAYSFFLYSSEMFIIYFFYSVKLRLQIS